MIKLQQRHGFFCKFLAVFLTAALLMGMLPFSVDAADDPASIYGPKRDYCDDYRDVTIGQIRRFLESYRGLLGTESVWKQYDLDPTGVATWANFDKEYEAELKKGGNLTPAEIIYWCCKQHRCNPVLLMTILELEQSLIEGTPATVTNIRYHFRLAAGFLQEEYYGFFGQVLAAAWRFREFQKNGSTLREAYEVYTPPTPYNAAFSRFASCYDAYAKRMDSIIAQGGEDDGPKQPEPSEPEPPVYDLNGDGAVTAADVLELLRLIHAETSGTAGDLNGDGSVDNQDLLLLMKQVYDSEGTA